MALHLALEALANSKSPARRVNEDHIFTWRDAIFLLDGATGVSPELFHRGSDAKWFVDGLEAGLRVFEHAEIGFVEAIRAVLETLRQDVERAAHGPVQPWQSPAASMLVARIVSDHLEILRIGDCRAFLRRDGSIEEPFALSPVDALDLKATCAMQELLEAGSTVEEARTAIEPMLRAHRMLMNQPEGYGVLLPDPASLEFLETQRFKVAPGDEVLFATDGFYVVFGGYHQLSLDVTFNAIAKGQIDDIVAVIRSTELADPDLSRYPRLKRHDDASAVLIRVVGD